MFRRLALIGLALTSTQCGGEVDPHRDQTLGMWPAYLRGGMAGTMLVTPVVAGAVTGHVYRFGCGDRLRVRNEHYTCGESSDCEDFDYGVFQELLDRTCAPAGTEFVLQERAGLNFYDRYVPERSFAEPCSMVLGSRPGGQYTRPEDLQVTVDFADVRECEAVRARVHATSAEPLKVTFALVTSDPPRARYVAKP